MKVERLNFTPNPELAIENAILACRNTIDRIPKVRYKKELHERIAYIFEHKHFGVLEHASATFHVSGISRACTHQLVRHRIASYAQLSMRAVPVDKLRTITPPMIEAHVDARQLYRKTMEFCRDVYKELVEVYGVKKEDARFVIPMGIETQITVTMNFRSWIHFLKLRTHKSAQWEIRAVANEIWRQLKEIAPDVFNEKYTRYWE